MPVVENLLRELDLNESADALVSDTQVLSVANEHRLQSAQRLLQENRITGVPALIVTRNENSTLVRGDRLFGNFEALLDAIMN